LLNPITTGSPFVGFFSNNMPAFIFNNFNPSDLAIIHEFYSNLEIIFDNIYQSILTFNTQLNPFTAQIQYLYRIANELGCDNIEDLTIYLNTDGTVNTSLVDPTVFDYSLKRQRTVIANAVTVNLLKGTTESIQRMLWGYGLDIAIQELWTSDFKNYFAVTNELITKYGNPMTGSVSGAVYNEQSYDLLAELSTNLDNTSGNLISLYQFEENIYGYRYLLANDYTGNYKHLYYKTNAEPVNLDILGYTTPTFTRGSSGNNDNGNVRAPNNARYNGSGHGIIIEEATTNMMTSGGVGFVTGWTSNTSVTTTTSGNQPNPFGGNDAVSIQCSGGAATLKYYFDQGVSTNGQPYASSMWVKLLSGTLVLKDNLGTTQTITSGAWTQVELKGTGSTGVHIQLQFCTVSSSDIINCVAWHPQIENKAFATRYQYPALGTRAAELLTLPTTIWSTTSSWSVKKYYVPTDAIYTGNLRYLFYYYTDVNNYARLYHTTTGTIRLEMKASGVLYAIESSAIVQSGVALHIVATCSASVLKLYINGQSVNIGISIYPMIGNLNNLTLGCSTTGNQCNGVIYDVEFFNVSLTSDQVLASYNLVGDPRIKSYTTYMLRFYSTLNFESNVTKASTWYDFGLPTTASVDSFRLHKDKIFLRTSDNNLVVYNYALDDYTQSAIYTITTKNCYFFDFIEDENSVLLDRGSFVEVRDIDTYQQLSMPLTKSVSGDTTVLTVKKEGVEGVQTLIVTAANNAYVVFNNNTTYTISASAYNIALGANYSPTYGMFYAADDNIIRFKFNTSNNHLESDFMFFDSSENLTISTSTIGTSGYSGIQDTQQYYTKVLIADATSFGIYDLTTRALTTYSYPSSGYQYSQIFQTDKFYIQRKKSGALTTMSKIVGFNSFYTNIYKSHYFNVNINQSTTTIQSVGITLATMSNFITKVISFLKPIHTMILNIVALLPSIIMYEKLKFSDANTLVSMASGGPTETLGITGLFNGVHPWKSSTKAQPLTFSCNGTAGNPLLYYTKTNFNFGPTTANTDLDNLVLNNTTLPPQ